MKTNHFKQYILGCFVCCSLFAAPATLVSCSDDTYDPDPAKNWAGTSTGFESTDDQTFNTYYSPAIGRCGDPMPFYDQNTGEYKVL